MEGKSVSSMATGVVRPLIPAQACCAFLHRARGAQHVGAVTGQHAHGFESEPGVRPGDERRLAGEIDALRHLLGGGLRAEGSDGHALGTDRGVLAAAAGRQAHGKRGSGKCRATGDDLAAGEGGVGVVACARRRYWKCLAYSSLRSSCFAPHPAEVAGPAASCGHLV